MSQRNDVREEKVKQVLEHLDKEDMTVGWQLKYERFKGIVFLAEYADQGLILCVLTDNDIAKWYDSAAKRMIRTGEAFKEALIHEWPASRTEDGTDNAEDANDGLATATEEPAEAA